MKHKKFLINYVMQGNALKVGNCSGLNMQPLVSLFHPVLPFTELHFANSDIKDSDVQEFIEIAHVVTHLCLKNCNNITDQGLERLVQIIKPQKLEVLYCSKITDKCIQQCKNTIDALTASASNLVSTTQCINKDSRGL